MTKDFEDIKEPFYGRLRESIEFCHPENYECRVKEHPLLVESACQRFSSVISNSSNALRPSGWNQGLEFCLIKSKI